MSILGSLFGKNVKKDDSVAELFKKPSKAVTNEQLRSSRTEVAVPEDAKGQEREESDLEESDLEESDLEESDSEESDSGESDSDDKVSHKKRSEEEDLEEPTKKKRKRDQDDNLEDEYFNRLLKEDKEDEKENGKGEESEESEGSAKEQANGKSEEVETKSARAKSVDVKEEELKKAEKTVFVGNVSSEVITSKKTYKKFKELFSDIGKVDSIRFRSISFEEILPRKVAFAKKKLLKSRDSVNAYVVFKEKEPSLKAVEELNATVFDDHHLRVDHVAHPAPKDNKRTIFVGNLDFEEKEETLWRHFNEHCSNDVELVRVVRDSATNLGKGFALVQFKDTLSVNKALLLNNKPVSKTSKRKLRITRATSKAKPSTISPNHIDNQKKNPRKKSHLSDKQRTKLGRAQKVLGKADRATAGKSMEGERAVKGDTVAGFGKKKIRSKKKNKITKRSTSFKNRKANV